MQYSPVARLPTDLVVIGLKSEMSLQLVDPSMAHSNQHQYKVSILWIQIKTKRMAATTTVIGIFDTVVDNVTLTGNSKCTCV